MLIISRRIWQQEDGKMKIDEVIRRKRKELNLTQEQIATILGVSAPAVNKWENGNSYPDITLLAPLARILGIDVNELLGFYENLSQQEVNMIIAEIAKIKEAEGFEAAFAKAEEAVRNYPNNNALMGSLVFVLNMYLHQESGIDREPYAKRIYAWLSVVADSGDEKMAESALVALCNEELQKKNFDKAQEYLDRLEPKKLFDKRITQAALFIEKGDFDSAYELYEKKIYEEVNVLFGTLSLFSELKCREKDYDTALRTANLLCIIGEAFQMGVLQTNASKLAVYADMQDADGVIGVLEEFLADRNRLASQKSYLNEHIKKENRMENESLTNLLRKMTELEKFDFLREDARFLNIVKRLNG